jgi:hypothetical protein
MVTNILSDLVLLSLLKVLSQYCKNNRRRVRWSVTVLSTRLLEEERHRHIGRKKDDDILKGHFVRL